MSSIFKLLTLKLPILYLLLWNFSLKIDGGILRNTELERSVFQL